MKKMTLQCRCDRCGFQDSVDSSDPGEWTIFTLLDTPKAGDLKSLLATAFGGMTDDRNDLCPTCTRELRTWFESGKLPQPVAQPPVSPADDKDRHVTRPVDGEGRRYTS